jgi:large subunit ribosomal protein L30
MPETTPTKKLRVTLVKSVIGYSKRHQATVRALGLRHINQTVVHDSSPAILGMLAKVGHLCKIEEQVQ